MKLIKPITVDDSVFISSSEAENEHAAWASSTSYSIGNKVIYAHRIYECLVAHTSTLITPDELTGGATPTWADTAPTNQWAMFDNVIGTNTTATDSLTVTLAPGNFSGMSFIELVGDQLDVEVTDGLGGTVVYSNSIDLDATVITSVWEYLFAEHQQKDKVALTDIPIEYLNSHITVTLTGNGAISCGVCHPGITYDIGVSQWSIEASFDEYANKVTDADTGVVTIQPKSDRINLLCKFRVAFAEISRVNKLMRVLKRQLIVYVPTEIEGYETYITFGYAYEYRMVQSNMQEAECRIEIEEVV